MGAMGLCLAVAMASRVPAATFTSKATGNYDAAGQTTWNEAGDPDNGAADDVTINATHTVTIVGANDATSDTVNIKSNAVLYSAVTSDAFTGAAIDLQGGTLRFNNTDGNRTVNGNVTVSSNSTVDVYNGNNNEADSVNNLGADIVFISTFSGTVFRFR